jgi:phage gp29-like protein
VALLDHRGRPVDLKSLSRESARPGRAGPRPWKYASVASALTPEKLAGILKKADEGDTVDLLTLAEELERRDSHAGAQLRTRRLALAGRPWIVEAASDDKRDVQIADELQAQVRGYSFSAMVFNLLDGILKPYAVSEIMWARGERWKPAAFIWRDPRSFAVDLEDGHTLRLKTEAKPKEGEDLPAWKFIQHTPRMFSGPITKAGLVRPLGVMYSLKTLGLSAWLAYMEIFGIPWRIGRFNAAASDEDKDLLAEALQMLGMDGSVLLPNTLELAVENAVGGGAGSRIHQELADWADRQASKAILGQTLTADEGASYSQGKIHDDVRRDILVADAVDLAATLQRDFVEPYCQINYGVLDAYPTIRCQTEEPEDRKVFVETVGPMVDRGLEVEQSVVRDRLGLPAPEKGEGGEPVKLLRPMRSGSSSPAPAPGEPPARRAKNRGLAAEESGDFIDREALAEDWKTTLKTIHTEIVEAARSSSSYQNFVAKLEAGSADVSKLVKSLALKTLQARGMGDATDDVEG